MTTYIEAMGLAYRNHTVMVHVEGYSSLTGELCKPNIVSILGASVIACKRCPLDKRLR